MSNERIFWEQLLKTMHPEWSIAIPNGNPVGSLNVAELVVHVYLVDASNLWVLMGSTREADAERAKAQTTAAPDWAEKLVGSIGNYLVECGDKGVDESSAQAHQAVSMSLLALSRTRTFDEAKRLTSRLAGHWLYILYRLKDGTVLARPGFIGAKGPGLLRPEELHGILKRIVATDTAASATSFIAGEISRGGGVAIHEALR
jgi:hypothetical protein